METKKQANIQISSSFSPTPLMPMTQTMPIYEAVRLSTAADHVGPRVANLQKAFDEYLQQFDACRCAPCKHNGVPVLSGTSCSCLCKSGYRGLSCEETLRGGEVNISHLHPPGSKSLATHFCTYTLFIRAEL